MDDAANAVQKTNSNLKSKIVKKIKTSKEFNDWIKSIQEFLLKLVKFVKDNYNKFVYQLNMAYAKEFTYYDLFLNVFFVTLLFVTGMILYWDNVYRSAKKLSRCSDLTAIIDSNVNRETPFVYTVMVISVDNIDFLLDKFVLKLEYDFKRKTTKIIYGEDEYFDPVKYEPDNKDIKNVLQYYDLNNMRRNTIDNINSNIITGEKYKYIPVTTAGKTTKAMNTKIAQDLAKFVKEYANNKYTSTEIIDNILNAVEQHSSMNI